MRHPVQARPSPRLAGRLAAAAGGGLLTGLLASARFRVVEGQESYDGWWGARRPAIYVLWHGRLLPCAYYHRHDELGTLISRHRDGDHIAALVERWGYRVVRGSSSRGATSALRNVLRLLEEGTAVALTPDGPRGPRQKMKTGPIRAAQLAGVPLIPVTASAARAWYFGRWDRFLIPRPFTRVHIAYGQPVSVMTGADAAEVQTCAEQLERRLNQLTRAVDASVRHAG